MLPPKCLVHLNYLPGGTTWPTMWKWEKKLQSQPPWLVIEDIHYMCP